MVAAPVYWIYIYVIKGGFYVFRLSLHPILVKAIPWEGKSFKFATHVHFDSNIKGKCKLIFPYLLTTMPMEVWVKGQSHSGLTKHVIGLLNVTSIQFLQLLISWNARWPDLIKAVKGKGRGDLRWICRLSTIKMYRVYLQNIMSQWSGVLFLFEYKISCIASIRSLDIIFTLMGQTDGQPEKKKRHRPRHRDIIIKTHYQSFIWQFPLERIHFSINTADELILHRLCCRLI